MAKGERRSDGRELERPLLGKEKPSDAKPLGLDANLLFSCLGNAFEWYDFAVFGFIAPELSKEIFPSSDGTTGLIEAFSVYAVAFLCRPVSGFVLGFLGDKWGRKHIITVALIMMGVATLVAGATPSYRNIGIWSPVLLSIARMLQGLSVGAQTTGTMLLVLEKSPYNSYGILTAALVSSQLSGFVLGALVPGVMRVFLFSPEMMLAWGWRVALWIGLIPCIFTFITHKDVTDEYTREEDNQEVDESALHAPKPRTDSSRKLRIDAVGTAVAVGIYVGGALLFYLTLVWIPVHLNQTVGPTAGLAGTAAVAMFALVFIPIAGYTIDHVDTYVLGGLSRFLNGLFALPMLAFVLAAPSLTRFAIMTSVMLPILAFDFVTTSKILVPYFPAEGRYVSIAVAHNLGVGLTGGTAPMIAQIAASTSIGQLWLGGYVSIALLVSALSVLVMHFRPRNYVKRDDMAITVPLPESLKEG